MAEPTIQTTLSAEEWKLVMALREIPDSPLRVKVSGLLAELMRFVQQPRCQGDAGRRLPLQHPQHQL